MIGNDSFNVLLDVRWGSESSDNHTKYQNAINQQNYSSFQKIAIDRKCHFQVFRCKNYAKKYEVFDKNMVRLYKISLIN